MTNKEFNEECNKEIRRYLQEVDEEYETEEKERIYSRYNPENDIEMVIKAVEAYKILYDSTPEEWYNYVKSYERTPTGQALKHIGKIFHLFYDMKYETKRDIYYHLCKIVGGE